jgi:hypothetical protein
MEGQSIDLRQNNTTSRIEKIGDDIVLSAPYDLLFPKVSHLGLDCTRQVHE